MNKKWRLVCKSYQQILSDSNVLRSGQAVDLVREIGYRIAKVIDGAR